MRKWRYFCLISDLCALRSMGAAPLETLLPQQQSGRVSEATTFFFFFFFFPLRFLLLDVTLCHSHSRCAALSISIIAAPLGWRRGMRGDVQTSVCVWMWLPLHQRGLPVCSFHARALCLCACMLVYVLHVLCVFSSLLLHFHPSVCRLPKPEAPVGFWGPSGRKRNDWAITLLLLSPQRCSTPPCLVFRPGGLCLWGGGLHSVSLSRSLLMFWKCSR